MVVYFLLLQIVVGLLLFETSQGLVCYDNVANDGEGVMIGCSYEEAACAVTNKTTTTNTTYFKIYNHTLVRTYITSIESETLYHCGYKSCNDGPMNFCTSKTSSQTVHCSTQCCDSDECNMPTDTNITLEPVKAKDALGCFHLITEGEERVKCLFEGARCLSYEIGPDTYLYEYVLSSMPKKNGRATQYCATKSECRRMKSLCDSYRISHLSSLGETCSLTCCDSDFCNTLSTGYSYGNVASTGHGNSGQDIHSNTGNKYNENDGDGNTEKDDSNDTNGNTEQHALSKAGNGNNGRDVGSDTVNRNNENGSGSDSKTGNSTIWIIISVVGFVISLHVTLCGLMRFSMKKKASTPYTVLEESAGSDNREEDIATSSSA